MTAVEKTAPKFSLSELAGAFGDFGTIIPLIVVVAPGQFNDGRIPGRDCGSIPDSQMWHCQNTRVRAIPAETT